MAKTAQSQWDALARAAREAYSAQQRKCLAETYLRGNLATLDRYLDLRTGGNPPLLVSDDNANAVQVAKCILDTGDGLLARLKALAQERDAQADILWKAVTVTEAAIHALD